MSRQAPEDGGIMGEESTLAITELASKPKQVYNWRGESIDMARTGILFV